MLRLVPLTLTSLGMLSYCSLAACGRSLAGPTRFVYDALSVGHMWAYIAMFGYITVHEPSEPDTEALVRWT